MPRLSRANQPWTLLRRIEGDHDRLAASAALLRISDAPLEITAVDLAFDGIARAFHEALSGRWRSASASAIALVWVQMGTSLTS